MLKSGAAKQSTAGPPSAGDSQDRRRSFAKMNATGQPSWRRVAFDPAPEDDFFLPDFCAPRMVLAIVLILELLALTFALAQPGDSAFLTELARISLFMQWLGLTGAAALCYSRGWLAKMSLPVAVLTAFALLTVNVIIISEAAYFIGRNLTDRGISGNLFPDAHWTFLLSNVGITAIVTAMLLRYFFVAHQWSLHVRAEARARIHALQARIRPHFFFNSMNTIASLTRSNPALAEDAVADLADLFRATMKDSEEPARMREELELCKTYQRIEELRLGDRLLVEWRVDEGLLDSIVPSLSIQPLLENAIHHGVEPLDGGGTVIVTGTMHDFDIAVTVTNPVAVPTGSYSRPGNRLALENIRERLSLAYGERGRVEVDEQEGRYSVTLSFPFEE
jgi:two-component system, LytTR family, sensor histidine kinase AlgZ